MDASCFSHYSCPSNKRIKSLEKNILKNKNKFLNNIFSISTYLLKDKDDLVQKGYRWTLKEANNLFKKDIYNYVIKRKNIMSRTTLRYAIEKMQSNLKKQAMQKKIKKLINLLK